MNEIEHTRPAWSHRIYELLRARGVTLFAHVPDAGHRVLIERSSTDPDVRCIPLTTEEEGVALAAGADLAGARAVLLMQSSGVGNCVNFLSLMQGGRFPLLTLVSMRGDFGEGNPWQYPIGMGLECLRVDAEADVESTLEAALTMVFGAGRAVAVLLGQRLIGAKAF